MLFKFKGGVRCEDPHHTEKFLLWFISGGEEISFYQALRMGLIQASSTDGRDCYRSKLQYLKVFCFQSRFGQGKQQYSFVIRLDDEGADVKIRGFGLGSDGYVFEARGEVLKRQMLLGCSRLGAFLMCL